MHSNEKLVSIGLPVYNGEEFIAEAIRSILNQTYKNFELIISDNASSDSTPDIIKHYAAKDSRIKIFHQRTNQGATANFTFTLDQAKGSYFMWAAHDDYWDTQWLDSLTKEIKPEDSGVIGEIHLFDQSGTLRRKLLSDFKRNSIIKYFISDESQYKSHYMYSLFNIEKLRGANKEALLDDYRPDYLFIYSILQNGSLRSTNRTYLMYRVHCKNLGKTYTKKYRGWKKIIYRVHPLSYYLGYAKFSKGLYSRTKIYLSIPIKHIYAQCYFWVRGAREILFRRKFY